MNLERYEIIKTRRDASVYEFVSEGPKGEIKKSVVFSKTEVPNLYNLGFGDVDPLDGTIDDFSISDNGDTQIILATVAAIVIAYTTAYPEAMVFAMGSTEARTRLYRIGITAHYDEMSTLFTIFGFRDGEWKSFIKNEAYGAFYVRRKK